jgi:hypothetical protein
MLFLISFVWDFCRGWVRVPAGMGRRVELKVCGDGVMPGESGEEQGLGQRLQWLAEPGEPTLHTPHEFKKTGGCKR